MVRSLRWLLLTLPFVVSCQVTGGAVRGDYDIDLKDRGIDDDSEATLLRFRGELAPRPERMFSGGMDIDVLVVDDDLFIDTDVSSWELFFFGGYHPKLGRFGRMPIRVGPTIRYLELDDSLDELNWVTFGLKGSVTPEIVLIRSREITEELSLFGDLNGFVGRAYVESDRFDTHSHETDASAATYGWGFEAGVRYRYKRFELQGSWFYNSVRVEEANRNFGPDETGVDSEFSGVGISMVIHFGPASSRSEQRKRIQSEDLFIAIP